MDVRQLQPPWSAETPTEQRRGAQCRSETARFEEARVEGWRTKERCHEFARFAAPVLLLLFVWLMTSPPSQSQRFSTLRLEIDR